MSPPKPRVAVVEDDADLCANTVEFLAALGYPVWGAGSGEAFDRRRPSDPVEVVVLDVELPGEDGFAIAHRLQAAGDVAVVMVTARACLDDRVRGLASGADTYLTKPVDFRELAANIDAVARRLKRPAADTSAPWRLDGEHWRWIAPDGAALELTAKEYLLVRCLAEAGGQVVSKAALAARLDGHSTHASFNRLDVLLSRLRKKGEPALQRRLPIRAVTAIGYALTVRCTLV